MRKKKRIGIKICRWNDPMTRTDLLHFTRGDVFHIMFMVAVSLLLLVLGSWSGHEAGTAKTTKAWELKAIKANAGYYHPKTGSFTWRELEVRDE